MGLVFHQTSRTLAAWDTGLEAVGVNHSQRNIFVKTRLWARGATLIEHVAAIRWTANRAECW